MRFGRPQFADAQASAGYCKYCRTQLKKIPINPNAPGSPFRRSESAVICTTCDGPGQLPPSEVTRA
jgi:hypothetical protein